MKKYILIIIALIISLPQSSFSQFGQNKLQYKTFEWYFIQTKHFDIYFTEDGGKIAEFTARAAESALKQIQSVINYQINNRVTIILYDSQNDFQETNVTDEYLSEGVGGFTELFKNRVVVPFTGSYKAFRHVLHHELVHAVVNDMFYGGSLQNVIANNISIRIPLWFNEGLAEYLSLGWETNTDMFIRDAITSGYLPDIQNLDGYVAYRGGQAVFYYIARKYGEEKIGEIVNKVKSKGGVEEGIKASIGLTLEELNERWKKEIKRDFWPDITTRKDPDEFSKRLTDHRKDGGFFNTSPALSPQGDKLAFISNRDIFFDVFLMNVSDGKIIKKLVRGNRTADFEELNILTPGLTWSPDGKKLALSAKSGGFDVIYIIDVETEDIEILSLRFDGITSVNWSPDNKYLTFAGQNAFQSDIFTYNFETKAITNLTNDIFSDSDPSWAPDMSKIFFSSDRDSVIDSKTLPINFNIYDHNYFQKDIYTVNIGDKKITRITALPMSDEGSIVVLADGKEILFTSDLSGISNIYRKRVHLTEKDTVSSIADLPQIPITNSLNGLHQITISSDGKKLAFSSMYQAAYNLFVLNNPLETDLNLTSLPLTLYFTELLQLRYPKEDTTDATNKKLEAEALLDEEEQTKALEFFTGTFLDTEAKVDTLENDFSNFVFGQNDYLKFDSLKNVNNQKFDLVDNLDDEGNFRLNRYKITFSPDIVYANAGYSTIFGLLGTTVISFSDVLGNHRIIGQTSLQIDLKNSDYGVAYYYLPKRIDLGFEAFHTARFVFLNRFGFANLYRFRNYGFVSSISNPLNRFYRIDGALSLLNVTKDNLDDPREKSEEATYLITSASFIHDNTIFGYTAPIEGTRYRLDFLANPFVQAKKYGFYTFLADYRSYLRFWYDYSFAYRFTAGYSWGNNPQRFFLGGIDNWINRKFATGDIPIESPSDFAFLSTVVPLRGFNYAEQIGSKYSLMNLELRFPLIRYLLTGVLPILFRNVQGVAFVDAGAAWNDNKKLRLFSQNALGNSVSEDLLMGTGVGARLFFLYFLLRFDVAWAYNFDTFSKPVFYFSIGADF